MESTNLTIFLSLFLVVRQVFPATITDADKWHETYLQNYKRNVRPIYDQSAVQVSVLMYIKAIQEFDEVNEKFSYTAALLLYWFDHRMLWDPKDYGGLEEATVSYSDVWVPELMLSSPASRITSVGTSTDRIRFQYYGLAQWMPAGLIESTCSVNARNYPFDTQSCTTTFASLGYKNYEVNLTVGSSTVHFDVYSANAMWDVVGSETAVQIGEGGESEISFTINIKRKSSYVLINVVTPILVLSVLNVFVFALVPESGERISYCITTLLAIAVYMTIVSDMLPQTSDPVPLISFKLMVDMFESASIVIVTILNMRLSSRDDDDNVPQCLQSLYRFFSCTSCRKRILYPQERFRTSEKNSLNKGNLGESIKEAEKPKVAWNKNGSVIDSDKPITWKKISFMVDMIAFVSFLLVSLISFTAFILTAKYAD